MSPPVKYLTLVYRPPFVKKHLSTSQRVQYLGMFGTPPRPQVHWPGAGSYTIDPETGRISDQPDDDDESQEPLVSQTATYWQVADQEWSKLRRLMEQDWLAERTALGEEYPEQSRELDELFAGKRRFCVLHGDAMELLRMLPENSIDFVCTDLPYELTAQSRKGSPRKNHKSSPFGRHAIGERGFMGKTWDGTGIAFRPELHREVLRVMKPGAHACMFGGTRTYHKLGTAMEAGGFDPRDTIHWTYGSGFPKALNVSAAIDEADGVSAEREVIHSYTASGNAGTSTRDKGGTYAVGAPNSEAIKLTVERGATEKSREWDGFHTALKPAHEIIALMRKPFYTTVHDNVLCWRTGALNIDATRIPTGWDEDDRPQSWADSGHTADPNAEKIAAPPGQGINCHPGGRWPANVILTHSWKCHQLDDDGLWMCEPDCPVRLMDQQAGQLQSGRSVTFGKESRPAGSEMISHGDAGPASRFFTVVNWHPLDDPEHYPWPFLYEAKASTAEREVGMEGAKLPLRTAGELTEREDGTDGLRSPRAGAGRTSPGRRNVHPTVKPVALLRHLVKLGTPPKGIVLDITCGSGSTGIAAVLEGFLFIGIELNDTDKEPYVRIARARIQSAISEPHKWLLNKKPKPAKKRRSDQKTLFG